MNILIVDDSPVDRLVMGKILASHGECVFAESGREALDNIRRGHDAGKPFDLVSLDILMPDMNGQEVLEEIRAMELGRGIYGDQGVRVIMVTALNDSERLLAALNEGCEAYLVKPVNPKKVETVLASLFPTPKP